MQGAGFILGQVEGLGFRGKSTASGSQLVAAQSPLGEGCGRYAMLLVEQSALGAPDAVVGATALRGGRERPRHHGLRLPGRAWGQGWRSRGPGQGSPLPQRLRWAPQVVMEGPEHSLWGAWDAHACASRCTRARR